MHSVKLSLLAAVLAVVPMRSAFGQVAWRTDLEAARTEALRANKLILVAVHESGEAGSEATRTNVWAHARAVRALGADVLPVMVCVGEGEHTASLPGVEPGTIRRDGLVAFQTLFGSGASIATPQILVMSPSMGVLWHHIREADLGRVTRGLDTARQDNKRRGASLLSWLRNRVAAHAAKADRDELEYQKLTALVRNANVAHLEMIFEVLAKDTALTERLLGAWFPAQPQTRARDLVTALERSRVCRAFATYARECEVAMCVVDPAARVEPVAGPLPEVRAAESLDKVRFLDGKARSLVGKPTVLLFLLPGAETLGAELAALNPVIRELEAGGVQCLALFASVAPDADRARIEALNLPCAAATYRFDQSKPFFGVVYFPGVLVLDENGRVVLADDGPENRTYTAFAPTARGLARYVAQRPRLVAQANANARQ